MQIRREAQDDVDEAYQWYFSQSEKAAANFLAELDAAQERVLSQPDWAQRHLLDTRRISLKRFPYSVIFREHGDLIVIIAVAHAKRDEAYWANH